MTLQKVRMQPFTLRGVIKLISRRIFVKKYECYGTAEVDGRRFKIRLSNQAITDGNGFLDTLLHELIHLWLFISMEALDFKMSEAGSHRIIDRAVPQVMKLFYKERRRKRRSR